MNFAANSFQAKLMSGGESLLCHHCGKNGESAGYGYDRFAKANQCSECAMSRMLNDNDISCDMSKLKPEYQAARQRNVAAVCQVSGLPRDFIEPFDTAIWVDSSSLEEYEDMKVYSAKLKKVVEQAQ